MTVNYTPTPPVAGQSRATAPTEVQRWTDYADTIADVDTRIDTLETAPGGGGAASGVSIVDAGGYYTGTDVEAALQEAAADLDAHNTDPAAHSSLLLPYSGTKLLRTSAQSVASGAGTDITWQSEAWDDGGWADLTAASDRVTVPSGVGKVEVKANISFAFHATGRRILWLRKNATTVVGTVQTHPVQSGSGPTVVSLVVEDSVVAGDYFQARVFQDSGAAMNMGLDICWMSVRRIDD